MPEDADLAPLRDDWLATRDGVTGARYAEALRVAGRIDAAVQVCREITELGFTAGYLEWAWLEYGRGEADRAIALMEEVADLTDDEAERRSAIGVAGHWRWESRNEVGAEPLLRIGMADYAEARVDLAQLLMTTGRREEGVRTLSEGVEAGQVPCMLPLANILSENGEKAAAEALYRRAFEGGDTYAAWNLAVLLWETDRGAEAQEWVWRAAESGDDLAIGYLSDVDPDDLDGS